jgi:2-keto-4-pentenoate hydratase/2-oxohepta-3-ene-1,7-dioic acid hydratase in catechol pathway
MRIARVLHESSPFPLVALERDGAVYDAGELDRIFDTPYAPDRLPGAADFHTRVVALEGAGLEALDEALRAGRRPTEARMLPGTFLWLPPCDTERALYVQMAPHGAPGDDREPSYRLGCARAMLGHEASVPFRAREGRPDFAQGIAAVLREDLCDAGVDEAEHAILGYTILNGWSGLDEEARCPGTGARDVPAQLGPVLVTPGEVGALGLLRAQARVDGQVIAETRAGGAGPSLAAAIAWVSRWVPLRAGDVIGAGCVHRGEAAGCTPAYGASVELVVERLGKLAGRPRRADG